MAEIGRVAGTRGRNCLTLGRRNLKYSDLCRYPLYWKLHFSVIIYQIYDEFYLLHKFSHRDSLDLYAFMGNAQDICNTEKYIEYARY